MLKFLFSIVPFLCLTAAAHAEILRGRISDKDGAPLSNIIIREKYFSMKKGPDTRPEKYFSAVTNQNGIWQIDDVPANKKIQLEASGKDIVAKKFTMIGGMGLTDIQIQIGSIIEGRVVDARGNPLANINVSASRYNDNPIQTQADGTFQLTGLPPKKYFLQFTDTTKQLAPQKIPVQIEKEGETQQIPDIVMKEGGVITGKITDRQTGKLLERATVFYWIRENYNRSDIPFPYWVFSDANGTYKLRVAPGKYDVNALISEAQEIYSQATSPLSVDITEGQIIHKDFQFDSGEELRGIATDSNGNPLKGITLYFAAKSEEGDMNFKTRETVTDANGHWEIKNLAPRQTEIYTAAPWTPKQRIILRLPHSEKVLLQLVSHKELPALGRLLDTAGKPLPNTKLTIGYDDNDSFSNHFKKALTTDANGYFQDYIPLFARTVQIENIDSEHYMWLRGGEWNEKKRRFNDAILDSLTRQVHGVISDENHNPVANARVIAVIEDISKETTTNGSGEFALTKLPHQKLTILAVGSGGVAELRISASADSANLQLKPLRQNLPSRKEALQMMRNLREKRDGVLFPPLSADSIAQLRGEFATENSLMELDEKARKAGLIFDASAAEGKVLFDSLLQDYRDILKDNPPILPAVSGLAYHLARYKPQESWLLLQMRKEYYSPKIYADWALAMSAIDFPQAMQWAQKVDESSEDTVQLRAETQRQLWEIAAATDVERRRLCVGCLDLSFLSDF